MTSVSADPTVPTAPPPTPTSSVNAELVALSDEELAERVVGGTVPPHSLEAQLGDCARAVRVRRTWLERTMGVTTSTLPHDSLDADAFYRSVLGACAEMVVGYVPLPVGVAGPLLLNGRSYQVPMATVEGTLVASTRRGCKAISESGGAAATVLQQGMTRAPVLQFPSAMRAAEFKQWLDANYETAKASFESTTRFGKLLSVKVTVAGRFAYARFVCASGDAMGMNMVSKGVNAVLEGLAAGSFPDLEVLGLSGNLCCDKKPAAINWIEGDAPAAAPTRWHPGCAHAHAHKAP